MLPQMGEIQLTGAVRSKHFDMCVVFALALLLAIQRWKYPNQFPRDCKNHASWCVWVSSSHCAAVVSFLRWLPFLFPCLGSRLFFSFLSAGFE